MHSIVPLAVALGLGILLRVFDLRADPAGYWPFGTAWGDEGPWNHDAAYAALTGRWPDLPPFFHTMVPVYAALQRAFFAWHGSGLVAARLLSVASGILTLVVVARIFIGWGAWWAAGAVALYGTAFWPVAVDRLATPEALCVLFLAAAGALLCLPERRRAGHWLAAAVLVLLAALSKPPAVFGAAALALFALAQGREEPPAVPRRPWLSWVVLAALVTAVAALGAAPAARRWFHSGVALQLHRQLELAGGARAFLVSRVGTALRIPFFYPFVVHHSLAIVGAAGLLAYRGLDDARARLRRRLVAFSLCWLLAWWVTSPFTAFRPFRYAFLPLPVSVLGVLGYERWMRSAEPARPGRRAAAALLGVWVLALWSAWLSDQTGLRARLGFPLLLGAGVLVVGLAARQGAPALLAPPGHRRIAWLLAAGVATQTGVFAAWAAGRTHLIATAQDRLAALPLGAQTVCGQEAPSLLLASPLNGRPLYYLWSPGCVDRGRPADFVLVPRSLACARAVGHPFFVEHHAELVRLPVVSRVWLPQWDGPEALTCEVSLSVLGRDLGGEALSPR